MKITLAGTNIPLKILERLPQKDLSKATPEVISAAYARISRSDKNVDELVDESINDIAKARKSNEAIIYGMGHHSVTDHVIFNLNITGVSRLLAESIEKRRLAGYTEKSQRYVTLDGDYIKPKEFSKQDLEKFDTLVKLQNNFYFNANPKLFQLLKKKSSNKIRELKDKSRDRFLKDLEITAKEDARYGLCLATETQLGCSYTGQTAELAIRELKYGQIQEEREFAKSLYKVILQKAPSVIQLTDPVLFKKHNPGQELKDDNFKLTEKNLKNLIEKTFAKSTETSNYSLAIDFSSNEDVALIDHNNPDKQIITALLHRYSNKSIKSCQVLAERLINNSKASDFIKDSLKYLSEFDKVPRAFEAGFLIYEVVLSASCFAQLKRHRMNTLLVQDYNPELGCTIPPNIEEAGLTQELKDLCAKTNDLYYDLKEKYGKPAEYCLTNAHRRRVIFAINIRQLYHFSRIREDIHSQWEIRDKAKEISRLAKIAAPATASLLAGKDKFKNAYRKVIK